MQAKKEQCKIHVLEILEATTGGTRRHLLDLVTHLDKDLFDISVICATLRDANFLADIEVMRRLGIAVHVVQMVRQISPARDALGFLKIHRYLERHDFAVVHTHSSKAGFLGRLAARHAGVPLIVHTPHVFPFQMETGHARRALYFRLESIVARVTDKLICVCQHEMDTTMRSGIVPASKCVVIENGISVADKPSDMPDKQALRRELGLSPDTPVVGMVGRLSHQKGHEYLVRAARQVVKQFPNVQFLLVGTGELRDQVARLINSHSLASNCRIVGPREDTASLCALFDVSVFPSLWEGLPYSLLEAMSTGGAVIVSQVGGMAEAVVHGETGLIVEPGDVPMLCQAMVQLLADPALRARMGKAARKRVIDNYRLDEMVKRVQAIYQTVVDRNAQEG